MHQFFDRVGLTRGDHVVIGFGLLQHEPHGLHVVAGVSPVALGVEVAHDEFVLQSEFDASRRIGDFSGDEFDATSRTFVIEQNSGTGVETVTLAVVDRDVMSEHLGASIRRTGMERRAFGLRNLADLAEHLRRRSLVEADRIVLGAADHAYCFEHAQHAGSGEIGREFGLVPGQCHERDGRQVVDLVGSSHVEGLHERRKIGQIAGDDLDEGELVTHHLELGIVLSLDDAVDLVALVVQELSQVLAVLTSDSGDEGAGHGTPSRYRSETKHGPET